MRCNMVFIWLDRNPHRDCLRIITRMIIFSILTRWCPRSRAKLVRATNSNFTSWSMVDISRHYSGMVFVNQRSTTSRLGVPPPGDELYLFIVKCQQLVWPRNPWGHLQHLSHGCHDGCHACVQHRIVDDHVSWPISQRAPAKCLTDS